MRREINSKVKRFCAFALTLALVGTSFPAVNFAEEPGEDVTVEAFAEEETEEEYLPETYEGEEPETEEPETAAEEAEAISDADEQSSEAEAVTEAVAESEEAGAETDISGDQDEEIPGDELETAEQDLKLDTYPVSSTITATLDSTGVLTVSGTGVMPEYFYYDSAIYGKLSPWYPKRDTINKIVISNGITVIGGYAFYECYNVTSVEIPSSVTKIGDSAFNTCSKLTSVEIPSSVTTLGSGAFVYSGLTSIKIPSSVTTIGGGVCANCSNLTYVEMPSSVTIAGISTTAFFRSCTQINTIVMTSDAGTITATLDQDGVFTMSGTGAMPNYGLSYFPWYALKSKIKKVVIKEGITTIANSAFNSCTELTSVDIPSSVTAIGDYAFASCSSLTSVTIPSSVTSLGYGCFSSCRSLTSVTIPSSVTSLGISCFNSCSGLTSMTINASASEIPPAFACNCTNLTSVDLSGSTVKGIGFRNDNGRNSTGSFAYCTALTEVKFPDTLEWIEYNTFQNSRNLTKPDWPYSLSFISQYAFSENGASYFPENWYPDWLERNSGYDLVRRALPFTDVPENYPYYNEIQQVYLLGLMTGTTPTTFEPETTLNRAFLAAVLYRRAGTPAQTYDGRFPDVKAADWFMPSVMWASVSGNIVGYANGKFGPTDALTREQLCTVLYRTAMSMDGCDNSARASLSDYPDAANVSDYLYWNF